jgi:general secretion pathway protein E/type IV pilus assembly protein PilB
MQDIPIEVLQLINAPLASHYKIIPYREEAQALTLLIAASQAVPAVQEELIQVLGKELHWIELPDEVMEKSISQLYRTAVDPAHHSKKEAGPIAIVQPDSQDFIQQLILDAHAAQCSDIHLEAMEQQCRIRLRIDGMLVEKYAIPKSEYPSIINKIKIQANLDIAEKRLPQDGRIFFKHQELKLDIRVSSLPTLHGEKIVLRLLGQDAGKLDIGALGMGEIEQQRYLHGIRRPTGMVLISGPTGSGKTTTLYATLKLLNKTCTNILTIEDPIEYTLDGINQVQLKESIGLDFASAMRTFLRQNPNIVMVGEIRDQDTANMAIRVSLTGHLVLSTIHTNSAWGMVARLMDMGIPPYLLADTLNTAVAQRLVRLLCPTCKTPKALTPGMLPPGMKTNGLDCHYVAKGCPQCFHTGYQGRKAIYEVIDIDQEAARAIRNAQLDYRDQLREKNIQLISDQARALLEQGLSSLEELYPLLIEVQ